MLKEHRRDISQCKQNTALARFCHSNESNRVDLETARIIILCNNPYVSKMSESLRIIKSDRYECNDNLSFNIHKIWRNLK